MRKKTSKKKLVRNVPSVDLSPEMEAFENLAKRVLSVPKKELDRREDERNKLKE
jgi:hypothetical protein